MGSNFKVENGMGWGLEIILVYKLLLQNGEQQNLEVNYGLL